VTEAIAPAFALEGACADDFEALHALRLRAMRESLERLGRWDPAHARERLVAAFAPEHTLHIVVEGRRAGFVVLKPLSHEMRLDHLCIDPPDQRRGIGSAVLRWVFAQADATQLPLALCVLKGSDANRFYLRHGCVKTGEGAWDIDYLRLPPSDGVRAVRALWAAVQARDWAAARALLHRDVRAVWWSSGERFDGADAFIAVNAHYPEGWTVRVIDVSMLCDGRVMSVVRVDHRPQSYFATSLFLTDDGVITAIDEYWATLEAPPAWRGTGELSGHSRFDPLADPRARTP
jgi:GNAT superfamily N-acetyltransferase/ketosteroid isomerase-like protein